MVLADHRGAVFVRGLGHGHPQAEALPPGLHMITSRDPNDPDSPRVGAPPAALARRGAAPTADDWGGWRAILADRAGVAGEQINVVPRGGFGTVCSSLLALAVRPTPTLAVRRRPAACDAVPARAHRDVTGVPAERTVGRTAWNGRCCRPA